MSGIDVGNLSGFNLNWLTVHTSGDPFVFKFALGVQFYRSISDHHITFNTSVDVNNFVGDFTFFHYDIWSFDEAIFVNTGISSKVQDETHVTTFWGFYSTDATVVGRVSITHIETSAFTSETTRTHR